MLRIVTLSDKIADDLVNFYKLRKRSVVGETTPIVAQRMSRSIQTLTGNIILYYCVNG